MPTADVTCVGLTSRGAADELERLKPPENNDAAKETNPIPATTQSQTGGAPVAGSGATVTFNSSSSLRRSSVLCRRFLSGFVKQRLMRRPSSFGIDGCTSVSVISEPAPRPNEKPIGAPSPPLCC